MAKKNVLRAELKLENRRAIQNAKQATQATREFGKQGVKSTDKVTTATSKLGVAVMGMVGAYAGMAGVRMILQQLREETERIDRVSRSAAESMRAVVALTSVAGRRPEEIQAMKQMAATAGRSLEEVSTAYYTLLGGTYGMAPTRQKGLMQQSLLFAKTDPRAQLDPIVKMMTAVGTQQPGLTPTQIGNLLSKTIEAAKATPEEMAQTLPALLASAKIGKLPIEIPLGMFAQVTRGAGGVATAATAGRQVLMQMMKTPAELIPQLARYGFRKDMTLMQKMQWLAEKGMELPEALMATLGGRRGIEAVATIATQPEQFRAGVEEIRGMLTMPGSELQQRLAGMYGEVPAQRYLTQIQQLETLTALEDITPQEMREQAILSYRALRRRKRIRGPVGRAFQAWEQDIYRAVTGEVMPGRGIDPLEALILEGYPAAEVGGLLDVTGPEGGYDERLEWYRGELKRRGAGLMQAPGGQQVSIGIQYNILESTRAMLPSKQEWALAAVGGIA